MSEFGEMLRNAVQAQDTNTFHEYLEQCALEQLDEIDEYGNTALHYAVQGYLYDPTDDEHNEDYFVRQLLNKGANPNIKNANGCTAFYLSLHQPLNYLLVTLFLGKCSVQVNNSGPVPIAVYYPDLPLLKKKLRNAGVLEHRVEANQTIHHHLTEQNAALSIERLAEDKTSEQIVAAYEGFKIYFKTAEFQQDLTEISESSFGEDYIFQMMQKCAPQERYAQLTIALPGLVQRMEGSSVRDEFQRVMGLMWIAIQEIDHLYACKVPHANIPLELKNLRHVFFKRLFRIEKEFLEGNVIGEAQCAPGTIKHVVDILTLVHDQVLVTDQVVTPEFNPKRSLATQLIAEDFKRLKRCITDGKLGKKGKKLAGYLSGGYFLQAHYSDFFKTGVLLPMDPNNPTQAKTAQKAQLLLELCLGWIKRAQKWTEDADFLALEDVLQVMPIEQFVQTLAPVVVPAAPTVTVLTAENAVAYAAALVAARAAQQMHRTQGTSAHARWQSLRDRARNVPGYAQIVLPPTQDPVAGLDALCLAYPHVLQNPVLAVLLSMSPTIQFGAVSRTTASPIPVSSAKRRRYHE